MREQSDRIERKVDEALSRLTTVGADVGKLEGTVRSLFNQRVQPGLLVSVQFQQMTQALEKARKEFKKAQRIAENSSLAAELDISPDQVQSDLLERRTEQTNRENELTTFLQDLLRTAETLSQTDMIASSRLQQATELYEQGRFAEANDALDEAELRHDKDRLLQQEAVLSQKREQLANEFMLKAQLTVLNKETNWFEQASQFYKDAIETYENYDTCFAIGYFFAEHNQHKDAIVYFEKAIRFAELPYAKSTLLNNLGALYRNTSRFTDAEQAHTEALQTYRDLARQNPQAYLPNVATTLNNLGNLYGITSRFLEAEQAYTEALQTYRDLARQNPQAYLPDVAMTLNNLSVLYRGTSRFLEAEQAYTEALQTYRDLARQNPQAYLPNVATTLNNLGNLYEDTSRFLEAEQSFTEALQIRMELATKSVGVYSISVAETAVNLSLLYRNGTPDSNKDHSIECALTGLRYALPFQERSPYALKITQYAIEICEHWGIDWREELQKRIDGEQEGSE